MKTSERGIVLVAVLVITALLAALVIEFAYGVHTTQASLANWTAGQHLSLAARSGLHVAAKTIAENQERLSYTYPGRMEFPLEQFLPEFDGTLRVRLEDENGKFNVNALVWPNGQDNPSAREGFVRLLEILALEAGLADRVADWIDRDRDARLPGSEDRTKNGPLDSVDELAGIPGVDVRSYEALLPHVTVYGVNLPTAETVNVNSAETVVLQSLHGQITPALAERIVEHRRQTPFQRISDIMAVPGFTGALGQSLMSRISVKALNLRITALAQRQRIRRSIECVVCVRGRLLETRYWKED